MNGGQNFIRDGGGDGEGWTERGAGALLGAGVNCGVERQALTREERSGVGGGGTGGDSGLRDRDRGSSARRGGKSCKSKMSYLFSSWMSKLGGTRERVLLLLRAPTRVQGSRSNGVELTGTFGLAPKRTQDSLGLMTGGGSTTAAGQAAVTAGSVTEGGEVASAPGQRVVVTGWVAGGEAEMATVSVCAGPRMMVSIYCSASWILYSVEIHPSSSTIF